MIKIEKQIGVGGLELGPDEKKYVNEVLDSNRLSYGPYTQKLEKLFAKEHNCEYASFCNSGTSALHIALAALKLKYSWKDGDEVIVPAVTFIATCNIVLHNNLKPIFVDIDSRTYNIDPNLIEAKITKRTRCIIPVHLFGMPADMEPIVKVAKKYDIKIIEDSCETMFAKYKGKKVGSFGEVGCFSTYIAHFLVTGIGGFATTSDPELAISIKSLMNHGRDSVYLKIDDDKEKKGEELYNMVAKRFSFVEVGHSFRATELEAAIGLGQMENKDHIIKRRREIADYFIQELSVLSRLIQLPYIPEDRDHMFMMFPIVLKNQSKWELVNYLETNLIETRDMLPLLNQPVYKKMFGDIEDYYPVAKWINNSGFYIGCHQYLKDYEIKYVVYKIKEYFNNLLEGQCLGTSIYESNPV